MAARFFRLIAHLVVVQLATHFCTHAGMQQMQHGPPDTEYEPAIATGWIAGTGTGCATGISCATGIGTGCAIGIGIGLAIGTGTSLETGTGTGRSTGTIGIGRDTGTG